MLAALVMVCAPVSACRPAAVVLGHAQRLSPLGPLLRACFRCRSLSVGSPRIPSHNTKYSLRAAFGTGLSENKKIVQDTSNKKGRLRLARKY